MMMNIRMVSDNTADIPYHLATDGAVDLVAVPSQGDEIRTENSLYLVTRVFHRPSVGPLLILSERPVPEYRGEAWRPSPGDAPASLEP
jgi:hypothetical protein